MSNTKNFSDLLKVCSVLPALLIAPAVAADDYVKVAERPVGTTDDWTENLSYFDASTGNVQSPSSVIFVNKGVTTIKSGTEFKNNKADSGVFSTTGKNGKSKIVLESGVLFEHNTALFDGGAFANFGKMDIDGVSFKGNKAQISFEKDTMPMGGGAIALGAVSETMIKNGLFERNESMYHGGAIAMRGVADGDNSAADLDIFNTEFRGNKAAQFGGAIYSTFYDSVTEKEAVYIEKSEFFRNEAFNAGAIYNEGEQDRAGKIAGMKIVDSDFNYNIATNAGGAIYNKGTLVVNNSDFNGNESYVDGGAIFNEGVLTINGGDFEKNRASKKAWSDEGYAGAIFDMGKLTINGTQTDMVEFSDNVAYAGGAIYGSRHTKDGMNLSYVSFENNHALADAGALGIFNDATSVLTNVAFKNNTAAVATKDIASKDIELADGGGAILLGQLASAKLTDVKFIENKSGVRGGAISARHFVDEILEINTSLFEKNASNTNGGAIANVYAGTIALNSVDFIVNSAGKSGGAIYNARDINFGGSEEGSLSSNHGIVNITGVNNFVGNSAGENGGAIYNDAGGVVNISGINTFSGNTAGKYNGANDIHNLGTVNVLSGTTSLDGGVTGNGTLNLAEGAVLNIGTANISQSSIVIDGTINADVLSSDRGQYIDRDKNSTGAKYSDGGSYAKLYGEISGKGSINLNVGSVGTYNMFDSDNDITISAGASYIVTNNGAAGVVIETKSVETLAQDAGISMQAAGAVAGLANATDRNAQKISLLTQQALNSGDVKTVERETAKLNPDDKPVTQAVSVSVQNQVLSLTSGRMSGGGVTIGRAGGDVARENGFWMQGLFNKSKHADQFHGYTRGFALGGDVMLNNEWLLGGGFAYNTTDVHANNSRNTDIESNTLFTYLQYKPNKWFANMTLSYTMSEYDENVDLYSGAASLNSNYDIDAYGAQFMTGYDFATGITTEIGARYLHVAQEEYSNGLNTVKALDTDFLSGVAGVKYTFAIQNDWAVQLKPEMRAAMTYDLLSDDAAATVVMPGAAPYKVAGEALSRIGGEFGIGLTAKYKGAEISLMYDLDLHEDYTSQTGMIKFRSQF